MFRSLLCAGLPALLLLSGCGTEATARPVVTVKPPIKDGSLMAPGRPQLGALPAAVTPGTVQPVVWHLWWGENGRRWLIYLNGAKVAEGQLPLASPQAQDATADIRLDQPGNNEIKVALCNDHGCTEGEPSYLRVASN